MLNQALYPDNYRKIGESFVSEFYNVLRTDRSQLQHFYHDQARMTYEGQEILGKQKIGEKFQSLPARQIAVALTSCDVHPGENSILIHVLGQLKCDEDPALSFCELFFLRKFNNCFLVTDSTFRLHLHNF
ncbi:unnamed protein product [Schistosoma turkestanicum]|nr:unnamed protein product [Schistosoma turkestanicum]